MWIFGETFEKIEEQHIRNLLKQEIQEQQGLEYKERQYGRADEDKREMLRDIISMANAYGGHLIIGIKEEESGIPIDIPGIEGAEEERDRMQAICLSNIAPRIPGLKVKTISIAEGNPVILILIPRSTRAPHIITYKGLYQFWIRHDRQKSRMSIEEIGDAFIRTENMRKDIEEFIEWRKKEILEEIKANASYVIGAGPIMVKDDIIDISDKNIRGLLENPPNQRRDGFNLTFDTFTPRPTLYGLKIEDKKCRTVELFRNGYLELRVKIIEQTIYEIIEEEKAHNVLEAWVVVEGAVSFYRLLKGLADYLGLSGPYVGFLGLYNIKGFGLTKYADGRTSINDYYGPRFWEKPHLEVPPIQIPSLESPDKNAKDFVDRIWQAFGYETAPLFRRDSRFELS